MFEAPYNAEAKSYTFNISYNLGANTDVFITKKEKFPITLIKEMEIGKAYKWFVSTEFKDGKTENSKTHYFSILNSKLNDPKKFKTIQHYNKKSEILNGVIWCDQYRCAVDRNGKLVWFVPDWENDYAKTTDIRDLKMNYDGNITLINQPNAFEYDLNFNVLWQAPTKGFALDSSFSWYHHAFQKFENGNYIVLANEKVNFANEGTKTQNTDFCNIIEFDKYGKIVWIWLMKEHFPYELLINSKLPGENGIVNPHANSFTLDHKNNALFLGFRNLNRIIKIDRATKKIIASYGTKLDTNDCIFETDLFKLQHDIQYLDNNDFLIFNNNDISKEKTSSIDIIHFPVDENDNYRVKFKFNLNYDTYTNGKVDRMGSVKILPNKNYLICEGSLNRISEITQDKRVVWDFVIQQMDTLGRINPKFSVYRANFSSSLYPYYFGTGLTNNSLTIYNKGSEEDSYKIELFMKNDSREETITEVIKSNSFSKLKVCDNPASFTKVIVTSIKSGKQKEISVEKHN